MPDNRDERIENLRAHLQSILRIEQDKPDSQINAIARVAILDDNRLLAAGLTDITTQRAALAGGRDEVPS